MKLTISTVALVALAATVSVAATGASQDKLPDAQRPAATMDAGTMLTGCVARGTAADTFTLAEAKKGAPAAAADASTPAPLVTLAGTEVDLSKHVGHSVTLTGSYATDAAVGTSGTEKPATTATPATPATPAATEDSKKAAKTFTVKSLKMVSPTC